MPRETLSTADYPLRRNAAERLIDRKVDDWRHEAALPPLCKAAAIFTGILGGAAAVGDAAYGSNGAVFPALLLTIPAMSVAGWVSGMSQDEIDVRHRVRAAAYKEAGLEGIRDPRLGPSLASRLSRFLGVDRAAAVIARAALWPYF
jgi:hypothetical protein